MTNGEKISTMLESIDWDISNEQVHVLCKALDTTVKCSLYIGLSGGVEAFTFTDGSKYEWLLEVQDAVA